MQTQQKTLYAAEHMTHWGEKFTDMAEVQKFLDELRENWWWPRRVYRVEAFADRRLDHSLGGFDPRSECGELTFPTGTPSMHVVLHELAHVFAGACHGSKSHDPWFARILLELTFLVRGSEAYAALAEAFARDGIDSDAPGVVDGDAIRA